jgi:uncharacterized membrane protein YGL010W
MPKKTADQWFAEYGESHQDHANELIHWICVPVIFFCVLGFLTTIPVPGNWLTVAPWFRWSLLAMVAVLFFYFRLSLPLALGVAAFMAICWALLMLLSAHSRWPIWQVCAVLFVAAWIGQFIGHKIEGKKPSFLNDIVFLLIGPAWLLSHVYRRLGIRY